MADTTNQNNGGNIDISNINNVSIQDNNDGNSIIGKINDNTTSEEYDNVDLRHIKNEIITNKKTGMSQNAKLIILFVFIIILSSIVGFIFYKYDKYIVDYSNGIEDSNDDIVNFYEKYKKKIYDIIGKEYEEPDISINLSDENGKNNLSNLIQGDNGYIYKKEVLKTSLKNLLNSVIENSNNLDEAKKKLSSNGFFSDELLNIISNEESITSIQDSLNAIEAIKLNSAIAVFSQLDTFIENLSNEIGETKENILENIKKITKRGEKDINIYIKNCRLNSFETDYSCNNVGDFDKYYQLVNDDTFNTKFFKKLIEFVNEKLEQTEVPSFTITFKSFSKQNNELTFDIEINTFREDEEELARKGILSSHSFILSNLINNLKLSRAIISEGIEVKAIPVNQRTIEIGETEFIVNTSHKTFSVPIKNENQIEIDDFLY